MTKRIKQMVFDTNCVLCSGAMHFILRHERDDAIQFINAWSVAGSELAMQYGLEPSELNVSVLVVDGDVALTKSDAVLALAQHLRSPWSWCAAFKIVPRFLRDALYTAIATRRYRIFGYEDGCFVPTPEMRARFVDR